MWFSKEKEVVKEVVIDMPKIQAFKIFRDGYYSGNAQCRAYKDSLIMENIITEDFEKYWKSICIKS